MATKCKILKAGREWEDLVNPEDPEETIEVYVNVNWINEMHMKQEGQCLNCKAPFEMVLEDGYVRSNITVDRIDNTKAHLKTNCKLTCIKCNCSRR